MSSIFTQLLQQEHEKQKQAVEELQKEPNPQKTEGNRSEEKSTPIEASYRDSYHARLLSSYHDSIIEFLRKAVRFSGKEPFFGRFTPEEKGLLKEIAYTYQRSGVKTTENEIARIAVNLVVTDYKENGENSLLDRVLQSLHA